MKTDAFKGMLSALNGRDLPPAAAALLGLALLFLVFKTGKFLIKVVLLLLAAGLFAGAYWWWQTHK